MLALSNSQLFYIMVTIGWAVRVVALRSLKLVLFLVSEWQIFIELCKTYSEVEKYPLNAPSHLKIYYKKIKTKFSNVWDSTMFLTNLLNWWIGLNQPDFFFFSEKRNTGFLYFIRGRCPMPWRFPWWHLFSVSSALADREMQCHMVLFQWQAANVFSVIKLAPGAERAWGNHQ